jgi:type I restriction enzyme R subunit
MVGKLKPYPEYRESGVPISWELRRLRHVLDMRVSNVDKHAKDGEEPIRLCNYVDVYKNERITERLSFMRATASPEEISRFHLQTGDVIITKDSEDWTDIGVPAYVDQVDQLVALYLRGAARDQLDAILDACVATYTSSLDEDGQVDFKSKAKTFVRTYGFLASILPFTNASWEKLSIFLNFLIPKLPAPKEEDLSKGVLESIDMESYRPEVRATISIALADQNAEIGPVPTSGGGRMPEPEFDRLSNIVKTFNEQFGNIDWKDADKIRKVIAEEIPAKVAADKAYQNAIQNSDKQNARIEHDKALQRVIVELLTDHTELFKQFQDNAAFKKWLGDTNFAVTYKASETGAEGQAPSR